MVAREEECLQVAVLSSTPNYFISFLFFFFIVVVVAAAVVLKAP